MIRINLTREERTKVGNPRLTPRDLVGCAGVMFQICLILPIWYFLLYQILYRIDTTTNAMWIAYWVYVPVGFIGNFLTSLASTLMKKDPEDGY